MAFLVVMVATASTILLLPPPAWPPWSNLNLTDRLEAGGLLLSTLGLLGFFISIAAGIAELNHAVPRQVMHFGANCSQSDYGPVVTLIISNGNAFIEFPFVTATAAAVDQEGTERPLRVIDTGPWELDRAELIYRNQVLYPKQITRPAVFQVPTDDPEAEVVITIVWSSERSEARGATLHFAAETRMGDYI